LATGLLEFAEAVDVGAATASGSRAVEVAHWLPIVRVSSD
jgi:hypothetical protein